MDIKGVFQRILDRLKDLLGVNELLGEKPFSGADLMAELEKKAEGTGLNWKTSVVDFLTLLEIDSSRENRAALAEELGISKEFRAGSAESNEALRVAVFKKLLENGGNVPADLVD